MMYTRKFYFNIFRFSSSMLFFCTPADEFSTFFFFAVSSFVRSLLLGRSWNTNVFSFFCNQTLIDDDDRIWGFNEASSSCVGFVIIIFFFFLCVMKKKTCWKAEKQKQIGNFSRFFFFFFFFWKARFYYSKKRFIVPLKHGRKRMNIDSRMNCHGEHT